MITYCHRQKLSIFGAIILFEIMMVNSRFCGTVLSTESLLKELAIHCQISGTVTDISSGMPVQNAKISLLDPSTRDVLCTEIYTNASGAYDANIEIEPTDVSDPVQTVPMSYWISEPYPNPISFAESNVITIQYMIPGNQLISPTLEVYNVLGKRVDQHLPLASGVYLYRLKFVDGHFSDTKKMLLPIGGRLNISLRQMYMDSRAQFGKNSSHFQKVLNDSAEVLYVVEKSGYAYLKQSKNLFDGIDNVHDFSLVQSGEEINIIIGSEGGTVEHPGGLKVEFQEGAFSSPVSVTLSEVDIPGPLPSDITQASSAFSINTGGVLPQNGAIVSFIVTSQPEEGTLGIYRWSWEDWEFAGGFTVGDTVSTYMRDFSIYLSGYATLENDRLFHFENGGTNNAMVYIWVYQLLRPDRDLPITRDLGIPCFTAPYAPPVGGNLGIYPQGFYQFCADWIDSVYGPRYRIIGGNPPHWSYCLSEYTSLIVPPTVFVNTSIAGSLPGYCPRRITQWGVPNTGLGGNWSGNVPPPWGPTNLEIREIYWIIDTLILTENYPVVLVNMDEQYIILMNYNGIGYIKIEWNMISDNEVNFSFFVASSAWDAHPTIEAAINDTTPEIENVIFTRTGG